METVLSISAAVPLGYAMVDRVARDIDAQVLAIKGPVPEIHGLRAGGMSIDVDVLAAPQDVHALCDRLAALGWASIDDSAEVRLMPRHSVTLGHESWPITIDIHHRFPGLLADPETAFRALWDESVAVTIAEQSVRATGRQGSALVLALHALRDPRRPTNVEQFAALVDAWRQHPEPARLLGLAAATGANQTARPFLRAVGLDAPNRDDAPAGALEEWAVRVEAGDVRGIGWARALLAAPWRQRLGVMWGAVWAGSDDTLRTYGMSQDGSGRLRARIRRFGRLVRDLPAFAVAAKEHRHALKRMTRSR